MAKMVNAGSLELPGDIRLAGSSPAGAIVILRWLMVHEPLALGSLDCERNLCAVVHLAGVVAKLKLVKISL